MRTRIIGVAVLASVLATCLFGGPLAVGVLKYLLRKERGYLVRVANDVAITVAPDVYDGGPIRADDLTDLGDDGAHVTAAVFDMQGHRLAGTAADGGTGVLDAALSGDIRTGGDGDLLVAAVPVTHGDEVIGAAVVVEPRSDTFTEVALIWALMAGLAVAAVTVAWLVGRWQARWLSRPLEDLEVSARRLGEGDFSVRTRRGGIPEIDSVGAALDTTAARLDDLLARERALSADVSHQLRTPLAGMRLRLEAAMERADPETGAAIAASLGDADRLEALIDEMVSLARAGQAASAGPVDLDTLLGELSPEWSARLALHGRDLEVQVDPGAPDAWASTAAVRQVLEVMVDNATTHGGGTVTLTVRETAGAVAIDVSDEGPGVQDTESTLFTRSADRRDGHGIGLALARRLAEAEQGRLTLTRAAPPVFTLLLPAADTAEAPEAGVAAARAAGR